MTTTDHFQRLPTFYGSPDECSKIMPKPVTNNRYSNFTQFCFTAGDIDQFETYRDPTNGSGKGLLPISIEKNRWKDITSDGENVSEHTEWLRYKNISTETVDNTFRYIFEKFKKGLFVKIKDNRLSVFLPFSKHSYVNEWSRYMKQPPSFKTMTDFLIHASKVQGYNITEDQVNKFPNTWYGNNCLIRTEFPVGENDRGLANFKDMLETLCNERKVPDIEFFINKRDFPILRTSIKGLFEPYDHIYGAENFPLISHRYETYCPILSMVTTDGNADVPMPTAEDWARVSSQESGKYFAPDCRNYNYDFSKKWDDRIPTAVFRGASTGCGTSVENNPRLKVAMMSEKSPIENGIRLLDAGITKWNVRPRKHISSPYLQIINPSEMPFGLVQGMNPTEQASYKYIVHVDGHVSAFRLSLELSMGSVLLIADSKYRMWFKKYLVPFVHFVPVKEDLSDLFDKIRWCRQNDDKCKEIVENAKTFYNNFLKKDGILDYMQLLLIKLKKTMGTYFYNSESISTIIREYQLSAINEMKSINDDKSIYYPYSSRNPNALRALGKFISGLNKNGLIEKANRVDHSKDTIVSILPLEPYPEKNKIMIKQVERNRFNELANEAFCGLKELNELATEIPNFRYTYGLYDDVLYTEYIDGITFKEFIEQPDCDMNTFTFLVAMITMALAVAQERCGFVHYDLYPWNIIIVKLDKPQTFVYRLKHNVYSVTTSLVPVLIDYGRVHIISKISKSKNKYIHTGTIEPFKSSRYQDIFCLIVSSSVELLSKYAKTKETHIYLNYIMYLVNFFTGTDFYPTPIKTRDELQKFLSIHKKYNEMIYGSKCNLEQKNPIEFFYYIASGGIYNKLLSSFIKGYGSDQGYPIPSPVGFTKISSALYYPIITQKLEKVDDEISSYLDMVESCSDKIIKQCKDEISLCYTLSMASLALDGVSQFMKEHHDNVNNVDHQNEKIKKIKQLFEKLFNESRLKNKIEMSSIPKNDMLCLAKYTIKTFSIPEKILTLLEGTVREKDQRLVTALNMFIFTSFYDVPYKISKQCFMKNKALLDIDPLVIMNHNANMNTLKMISRNLYPLDIAEMRKMELPPEKTIMIMSNILDVL